jgi:UDP-sulfoquinovose synthase
MGVYGYKSTGFARPEGYLSILTQTENGLREDEILYPADPESTYHLTKAIDQLIFQYYAKHNGLRITDLHQGIIWGTQTPETALDERLINRFDYDGDFGTVLNRFLVQAVLGYPLTVYGSGGQTRAFIHIRDTVRGIAFAAQPAGAGRAGENTQSSHGNAPGAGPGDAGLGAERHTILAGRQSAVRASGKRA